MTTSFGYMIFYVSDVDATLAFYEQGFGLERRFLTPEGDYGELATGSTTLAFASIELAAGNLAGGGGFAPIDPDGPPVGASMTLLTDDVAALLDRAVQAGASRYTEPAEKPWGQTVAYVRDPNGVLVEIATPVPT